MALGTVRIMEAGVVLVPCAEEVSSVLHTLCKFVDSFTQALLIMPYNTILL